MKQEKLKDGQHWIRVGEPNEMSFSLVAGKVTVCSDPAYKGKSMEEMLVVMAVDPIPQTHFHRQFPKAKRGEDAAADN